MYKICDDEVSSLQPYYEIMKQDFMYQIQEGLLVEMRKGQNNCTFRFNSKCALLSFLLGYRESFNSENPWVA